MQSIVQNVHSQHQYAASNRRHIRIFYHLLEYIIIASRITSANTFKINVLSSHISTSNNNLNVIRTMGMMKGKGELVFEEMAMRRFAFYIFRLTWLIMAMTSATAASPTAQPFLSFAPIVSKVPTVQPTVSFQPSLSQQPSVSFVPTATIGTTTTYSYTGTYQSFVVPASAATMTVTALGAGGSTVTNVQTCTAGYGAKVVTFTVVPGTTYYVFVGGAPTSASAGFNGGGTGGSAGYSQGGCGATDIRTSVDDLTTRIIVAGGGGGCYINVGVTMGGNAGLDGFQGGTYQQHSGGFGGTQTSGGSIGNTGGTTTAGTLGQGGSGDTNEGGGGGGGYYGGGGSFYSAGGGGSSYPSTATITDAFWTSGYGQCTVTFYAAPSVVPTISPTVLPTTILPTVIPSIAPSLMPSILPTRLPTTIPTILPSITPTIAPSIAPSVSPTIVPTTSAPSAANPNTYLVYNAAGSG